MIFLPDLVEEPVLAFDRRRRTNAVLIADVARLGVYLHNDMRIWDPTYGMNGGFWRVWRPDRLVATDGNPELDPAAPDGVWDCRAPIEAAAFDAVTFDPPYKLNGRPSDPDKPYGVHTTTTRDGRHAFMREGLAGCVAAVKPGGYVLVKCQVQVNGGRKWWQPRMVAEWGEALGCVAVDEFQFWSYRAQPKDPSRKQDHARVTFSTLVVLRLDRPATLFG